MLSLNLFFRMTSRPESETKLGYTVPKPEDPEALATVQDLKDAEKRLTDYINTVSISILSHHWFIFLTFFFSSTFYIQNHLFPSQLTLIVPLLNPNF